MTRIYCYVELDELPINKSTRWDNLCYLSTKINSELVLEAYISSLDVEKEGISRYLAKQGIFLK